MKLRVLLLLFVFSTSAYGQCQHLGDHELLVKVLSCEVNPDISPSGIFINGQVIQSSFRPANGIGNIDVKVKPLAVDGNYKFFAPYEGQCKYVKNKTVKAKSIFQCCDTIPAKGLCLIPQKYMKIQLES